MNPELLYISCSVVINKVLKLDRYKIKEDLEMLELVSGCTGRTTPSIFLKNV